MFDRKFITHAIDRSATNQLDRRLFMKAAGITGLGAGAATLAGPLASASAAEGEATDLAVLNFALNLEYLEAEFYVRAVTGNGLPPLILSGQGTRGAVTGGRKVPFQDPVVAQYAKEIAADELDHVVFLRKAIGSQRVSEPAIDLVASFNAVAMAAGLIQPGQTFDAFADDTSFLLAAYLFEDVGVTAYKGAAPLITNKTFLEAAAGILAVEAYHAANIRTVLFAKGLQVPAAKLSAARDSLDGPDSKDQGIVKEGISNITPADANGIAFSRSAGEVLNIVYINPAAVTSGGFFPAGVNGPINTSDDNA